MSPIPITTVTAQDLFETGRISVGDTLNQLPQLRPSPCSQNSTAGLGGRGLNFLDLRDPGRARTPVLVNGRRHVTADIINNGNTLADGCTDPASRHAGRPVTHGAKWLATRWIRADDVDPWAM